MTYEEAKEKTLAKKKKGLKVVTDDIYLLYQSFVESGFSDDQAFELTNTYVRQTIFDNILRANNEPVLHSSPRSTKDIQEMLKKFKEKTDD